MKFWAVKICDTILLFLEKPQMNSEGYWVESYAVGALSIDLFPNNHFSYEEPKEVELNFKF